MKERTKKLLDAITSDLAKYGWKRRRRGLVFRQAAEEGVFEVLSVSPREVPGDIVEIRMYAHALWEELEKICAVGWNRKYRFGDSYSMSRLLHPECPFLFSSEQSCRREIDRMIEIVEAEVPRVMTEICRKDFMRERILIDHASEAGYPEKILAVNFISIGNKSTEDNLDDFSSRGFSDCISSRLREFWKNIQESDARSDE